MDLMELKVIWEKKVNKEGRVNKDLTETQDLWIRQFTVVNLVLREPKVLRVIQVRYFRYKIIDKPWPSQNSFVT